jgi:hypothetical protein
VCGNINKVTVNSMVQIFKFAASVLLLTGCAATVRQPGTSEIERQVRETERDFARSFVWFARSEEAILLLWRMSLQARPLKSSKEISFSPEALRRTLGHQD